MSSMGNLSRKVFLPTNSYKVTFLFTVLQRAAEELGQG